ncbi:hypothetical protein ACSSS7_000694 [Eimeria intestinalis]
MTQVAGADLHSLKVAELRNLLAEKGLPTTGKKTELIERLTQAAPPQLASASTPLSSGAQDALPEPPAAATSAEAAPSAASASSEKAPESTASAMASATAPTSPAVPGLPHVMSFDAAAQANQQLQASEYFDGWRLNGWPTIPLATAPPPPQRKTAVEENIRATTYLAIAVVAAGIKTDEDRFGLSAPNSTSVSPSGSQGAQVSAEEAEKRRKRAERFGIVDEEERKKRRAERFGIMSEEEKLQKRLQRFAGSATA